MSQTLSAATLLVVPMAPLVGAVLAGIFGTQFGGNWIGRKFSHSLTIGGVLLAFVLSALTLQSVVQDGARLNETLYTWMVVGGLKMEIGFLVDGLTAMMMCVVTFVSLMVHVYTIGYMDEDEGYNRFFAYISLFTFAMLMLVMSNNMLQLFFGWEAVGLVSYLLIGFWFNKPSAIFANMKAFLVNRVGDFGFILGIGLLAAYTGTLNYVEVFGKASDLTALMLPGTDWMLVTVICICLFIGAMGKSAQFPLHVWLPDSMEGPTPISALIHAATMVTAGIFMVARMSPLFELSDAALNFILVIGAITALFMGFLGIIQNDIRWMGGVRKYMPITWITSLLGSLALIGTPFFSGFYSKDSIIEAVAESHLPGAGFAYFAVLAGVFVTAFYSFRMYFLVFHGKERYDQNPDVHHDAHHAGKHDEAHGHHDVPHESPWVVWVPLVMLAIPSVVIGFMTIEPMLFGEFFKDAILVNADRHPVMQELGEAFHGPVAMAVHAFTSAPFWLALGGVVTAWYMYLINPAVPAALARALRPLVVLLENKYFLDWINENILARGARLLGTGLWKGGDRMLIDGLLVNGSWKLVGWISGRVRQVQSGYLYHYALAMILGIFVLMTYFVWLNK